MSKNFESVPKLHPYYSSVDDQGNSTDESSNSSYKPSENEENREILPEYNEALGTENVIQDDVEAINENEVNKVRTRKRNPNTNEWIRIKNQKLRRKGDANTGFSKIVKGKIKHKIKDL